MAKKQGFLTSGVLYFANNSLVKILGFLFTYFSSNYLGSASYGVLTLVISITLLAASIGVGGFQVAAQKMLNTGNKTEENQIIGFLWITTAIVSLICLGFIQLALPYIDTFFSNVEIYEVLMILSFGITFVASSQLMLGVFKAKEKPEFVLIVDVCNALTGVLIILLTILLKLDLYKLALLLLARDILTFIISSCLLLKLGFTFSNIFRLSNKLKILNFSFHLFLINLGYFFIFNTGRYLSGFILTPNELGIYSLALSLGLLFLLTHVAFSSVFKPLASSFHQTNDLETIGHYYRLFNRISSSFNGIIFMVYLGFSASVLSFFGDDFTVKEGQLTLIILAGSTYIYCWTGLSNGLLQMTEKQKNELIITVIGILFNVVVGYLLGTLFGLIGIASATFISIALRTILQLKFISRNYTFKTIHPSQLWGLSIIIIASSLIIFFDYNILISASMALCGFLFFFFQLFLILKNYKTNLQALIHRFKTNRHNPRV
ncbi:oligosaccharide flippase family protein [Aquimarina pacifica]|uniref:oligosaccharide flippase family protein n=1 Tax=Aquimarina pacifica TaxID=1296415 RepID=UPI00046E7850|nr:oligosaccharide flippase family protein [Aquimarina pacifica]